MRPRELQGARTIAGGRQRPQETERDARVEAIGGREPPPPIHGFGVARATLGIQRQLLERSAIVRRQFVAHAVCPALELGRVGGVYAIEKSPARPARATRAAAVDAHGLREVTAFERRPELGDVAGDPRRIQSNVVSDRRDSVFAERFA